MNVSGRGFSFAMYINPVTHHFGGAKRKDVYKAEQNGRKLTTHDVLRMDPFLVYEKAESCF